MFYGLDDLIFEDIMESLLTTYMALTVISIILWLAFQIFVIIGRWKMYVKAGEHGWAAIIPFYNSYIKYKISWGTGWLFLLDWFLPIWLITRAKLARAFGKQSAFIVGTIYLEPIFTIILGFGSSEYCGVEGEGYYYSDYEDAKRGLLGLSGQWNGAEVCDGLEEGFVIGRDGKQCNIVIVEENSKVSRKHCSINYDYSNDEYIVTDYSSNGTFLNNGTKLDYNAPVSLPSGTILLIGDRSNMFRLM